MRIDPSFFSICSAALEVTLNEALSYDSSTAKQLQELDGERIALVIEDRSLVLSATIIDQNFAISLTELSQFYEAEASVKLEGKLNDYLQLVGQKSLSLAGSGVEAKGNLGTLESLQKIFTNIDIDWRDALDQKLGPFSYPIAHLISTSTNYLRESTSSNFEALKHYITHELNLNVHADAFEQFREGVSELRQSADRAEARLNHLLRHPKLNTTTTQ